MKLGAMLSDQEIRASWEAERDSMHKWLITEKKFNPKSVDQFIDNYIESMVFAKLPCPSKAGIRAAFETRKPLTQREAVKNGNQS